MVKEKKKKVPEEYFQMMFMSFLKSVREEKSWTQTDLANALGISKSAVEKYESKAPSKISEIIPYLQRFADLKGISVLSFVSIIMGELNEEGKDGSAFSRDILKDIEKLGNIAKSRVKHALKNGDVCDVSANVFSDVCHTSKVKKNLYRDLAKISDEQAKILIQLIDNLK